MIMPLLAALALGAQAPAEDAYKALAEAYIGAFDSCEDDAFAGLLSEDHRSFIIQGAMGDGFSAPDLKRQCKAGYVLSLEASEIAALEQQQGFASALIEIRTRMKTPDGTTQKTNLRVSLMMEDRGDGPKIVRSHISALR
ncbi:MAG: hypothetical protein AAF830_03245 [Pseudomonadota bacterium]